VRVLGLIADDLTGAGDSAVQFARRGWKTLLALGSTARLSAVARSKHASFGETHRSLGEGGKPDTTDGLVAVTTDARALDNRTAERLTADALTQLIDAGVDRVYLKIDSTMRGSVPGQIAGALAVWRMKHPGASAVVCPAYPRMGRTVVRNHVLVNGQPVEQSSIGSDPVSPVRMSDLRLLIPGSSQIEAERISQNSAPVVTTDAISDEDLATIAAAIADVGPSMIPVGSAGLAEAMAGVWSEGPRRADPACPPFADTPRILILVTSLHPASRAQVARLANTCPDVSVVMTPAERVADTSVAEHLVEDFSKRFAREQWDVLGFVGGDGARAALGRLGASAIHIHDAILEGIPFGTVVGGLADGMPIFTKAGGFGDEDALVRVIANLKDE
jgi:uncharacterized protein YgbK (DUF1537 family)